MILVAGLSPAWQQILAFDQFQLGQVNRAAECHWCASGKVLNVGIAAHHLAAETTVLTLLGGKTGELAREDCERLGVPLIAIPSATPTRVCTTLVDRGTGTITELVENAAPVTLEELSRFETEYRTLVQHASVVVLTGSLPAGIPVTFYRDLLRESSVPAILDVRGPELLAALPLHPWLVKPNREELGKTFPEADKHDLTAALGNLIEFGAEHALITQGGESLHLKHAGGHQEFQPPSIRVVNPIGCGDSLAAGIAVARAQGESVEQAIRWGMAAAAANAAELLPARFQLAKVREFLS